MAEEPPLLNIYEVPGEGRTHHLVGFMEKSLADANGLASHAMVGEFEPGPDGEFDPDAFHVNPEFLDAVVQFLNHQPANSPDLTEAARQIPGQRFYVVDPRNRTGPDEDPPASDLLGWYEVDEAGRIVPDSFTYNPEHRWFCPLSGVSGLLLDRPFYEFLHPQATEA